MKTNPRTWQIGGLIIVLLAAYAGWALMLRPVFGNVAQAEADTVTTQEQTDRVRAQTAQLAEQQKDLQDQIDALMRLRAKIPKDVNVPVLMRTIQAEARAEGVELDSLQPGQITLFSVPEPTPAATDSASPTADATQAPEPTPSDLGQGIAPKNAGLAFVPLSLGGQGDYASIRRLISRLEHQQRAFLVTTLDVTRSDDTSKQPLLFTMSARVFVLNSKDVQLPASVGGG